MTSITEQQEFLDILKFPLRAKTLTCLADFKWQALTVLEVLEVNMHMTGAVHVIQVKTDSIPLCNKVVTLLIASLIPLGGQFTLSKPATSEPAASIDRLTEVTTYTEIYFLEEGHWSER